MTPLQKRLQALEAKSPTIRTGEGTEIDAVMDRTYAQVELMPPAPGDTRAPKQRLEDALTSEAPTADDAKLLDSLPFLDLSPALRRSLMKGA